MVELVHPLNLEIDYTQTLCPRCPRSFSTVAFSGKAVASFWPWYHVIELGSMGWYDIMVFLMGIDRI